MNSSLKSVKGRELCSLQSSSSQTLTLENNTFFCIYLSQLSSLFALYAFVLCHLLSSSFLLNTHSNAFLFQFFCILTSVLIIGKLVNQQTNMEESRGFSALPLFCPAVTRLPETFSHVSYVKKKFSFLSLLKNKSPS